MAHKFFTVMVVGDNPESLMSKYGIGLQVPKYMKYKYLDAQQMKDNAIKILEKIISEPKQFQLTGFQLDVLKEKLQQTKNMTSFDYYSTLTQGLEYDDEGNAWCDRNPDGKWKTYQIGRNLSIPLVLKNNEEAYQARKGDVEWASLHMTNQELYQTVWALIKEGKKPSNEIEAQLFENMKDKDNYFSNFKTVEDYVIHNCAYWNYAFLDVNGWFDIDSSGESSSDWIKNYFKRFIEPLSDDTLITIYECSRDQETQDEDIF